MYGTHTQTPCATQDFLLAHFMNKDIRLYCGHKGEAYEGRVVECAEGILTIEKDGRKIFIACDKIESMEGV